MDENLIEVPALVVGAGPAGLTAALTLARHGVECLLVERRPAPSDLPRASVVSLRSMEILRGLGLEAAVRAGAADVDWALWWCDTLSAASAGTAVDVGIPSPAQSAVLSPTAPACVAQDHLEAALLDELRALPGPPGEPAPHEVFVPLRIDGLSFLSTRTTFATALDVTVSELAIEAFFPADRHTAQVLSR